jgi:hypothetical protein
MFTISVYSFIKFILKTWKEMFVSILKPGQTENVVDK